MPRHEARLATVHSLSQGAVGVLAPDRHHNFKKDFCFWAANPATFSAREPLGGEELVYPFKGRTSDKREKPLSLGASQGLDTTLVAGMFFQVLLEAEHLPGNTLERTSFVKQAVRNFLVQRLAGQITLSQFFRLVQIIEYEVTYYFHRLQEEWLTIDAAPPSLPLPGLGVGYTIAPAPKIQTGDLRLSLSRLPLPHQANRKLSPEALLDFLVKSEGRWFRLMDFESHFRLNKKTAWTYLTLLLHHDILRHNDEKANKVRYALSQRFMASENTSPH